MTDEVTYKLELTAEEVMLLANVPRAEVIEVVDRVKMARRYSAGFTDRQALFLGDAIIEAQKKGRLIYQRCPVRLCNICHKMREPITRGRNGQRLKEVRFPLWDGIELAYRFISVQNHITLGGCAPCVKALHPALTSALSDVEAEIPEAITGHPPVWKWNQNRKCTKCSWEGHEGLMIWEPAILSGKFPSRCPKCNAGGSFSKDVSIADGFTLVRVS